MGLGFGVYDGGGRLGEDWVKQEQRGPGTLHACFGLKVPQEAGACNPASMPTLLHPHVKRTQCLVGLGIPGVAPVLTKVHQLCHARRRQSRGPGRHVGASLLSEAFKALKGGGCTLQPSWAELWGRPEPFYCTVPNQPRGLPGGGAPILSGCRDLVTRVVALHTGCTLVHDDS